MTYANRHPSDSVQKLAEEVETAVAQDLNNTRFLLGSQRTEYLYEAFKASERSHQEAMEKTERLMEAIRNH